MYMFVWWNSTDYWKLTEERAVGPIFVRSSPPLQTSSLPPSIPPSLPPSLLPPTHHSLSAPDTLLLSCGNTTSLSALLNNEWVDLKIASHSRSYSNLTGISHSSLGRGTSTSCKKSRFGRHLSNAKNFVMRCCCCCCCCCCC